jgi:hypothetical protein
MLQEKTCGTRPYPNSETSRDDDAKWTGSRSAGKEHEHPRDKHKNLKSEKACMTEMLAVTRTTTADASEGLRACDDSGHAQGTGSISHDPNG